MFVGSSETSKSNFDSAAKLWSRRPSSVVCNPRSYWGAHAARATRAAAAADPAEVGVEKRSQGKTGQRAPI